MTVSYALTGVLGGIGSALVRQLAAPGVRLCLNDFSVDALGGALPTRSNEIDRLTRGLQGTGADVRWVSGSVAEPATAEKLLRESLEGEVTLGGVVNCAGVLGGGRLDRQMPESWRLLVDTHLTGSFYLAREFARAARAGCPATLVLFTSAAGLEPAAENGPYGVAKAGVAALAQCVADETGKYGARSYAIAPWAFTRMAEHLNAVDAGHEEHVRALTTHRAAPLPRKLDPAAVARTIRALLDFPEQLGCIIETADSELAAYTRSSGISIRFGPETTPSEMAQALNRTANRL